MRKFALKSVLPVTIAVTGFVTVCWMLLYQVVRQEMISTAVRQEAGLADTVIRSTRFAMMKSDRDAVANIVANIGSQKGVDHVRIFNHAGVVQFSSRPDELHLPVDRRAEGCETCHSVAAKRALPGGMGGNRHYVTPEGQSVIAVTAPIFNDSECFSAPCHYHPKSQQLLGTLDIGMSAKPLDDALRSLGTKMGISALMVLVVTSAGVTAVLRRTVLLPVRRLAEHARQIEAGKTPPPLPQAGDELDIIARVLDGKSPPKG